MGRTLEFLNKAFNPLDGNPGGINTDAIITLVGLTVWVICILGEAFGYATMPLQVSNIGSLLFGLGLGSARNKT